MSLLRQVAIEENFRLRPLRPRPALVIIFLGLSTWLHLIFFTLWQHSGWNFGRFELHHRFSPLIVELTLAVPEEPAARPSPSVQSASDSSIRERDLESAAGPFQIAPRDAVPAGRSLWTPLPPDGGLEWADEALTLLSEAPEYKSYFTVIRGLVARKWIIPPEAKTDFAPGRLAVELRVNPDGQMERIVILESSGSARLDHAGLEALRAAAPFPGFPEELAGFDRLDIRVNFDYRARYVRQ